MSCTGTLANTVGAINPMRYRDYYFDSETGYYYLQSRYYNPEFCRFINADEPSMLSLSAENICGVNLFAYCHNNPVNLLDWDGHFGLPAILAVAITASVIGAVAQLISNILSGLKGKKIFKGVLGSALRTGVNATLLMIIPFFVPGKNLIAAFAGGAVQAIFDFLENVLVWKTKKWKQFGVDVILNTAVNATGNYLGNRAIKINGKWFQPKHFKFIFTGSYGKKLIAQSGIGGVINGIANLIRKKFKV